VDERQFNELAAKTNNKATVLSTFGLRLLKTVVDRSAPGDMWMVVDKNGGRDHYLNLLMHTFPDATWRVCQESALLSRYQCQRPGGTLRIDFQQKGEDACLATAWASMISKYLRERAMEQFNIWWRAETGADVKPTAGYYSDAQRWLAEMAPYLERCGPPTEQWVRIR
jgi:ribonuclease HIII